MSITLKVVFLILLGLKHVQILKAIYGTAIFTVIIVAIESVFSDDEWAYKWDARKKWLQVTIQGNIAEAPGNESIFDDPSNFLLFTELALSMMPVKTPTS